MQAAAVAVAALLRCRLRRGRLTRRGEKIGNILLSDAGWPRIQTKKKKKQYCLHGCTRRLQTLERDPQATDTRKIQKYY